MSKPAFEQDLEERWKTSRDCLGQTIRLPGLDTATETGCHGGRGSPTICHLATSASEPLSAS